MREECRDTAILLRTYDLSESSLIVHWLTENYGICKTVVKGAKSKNSRYSGKLELFSFCEVHFIKSGREADLHALAGCEVLSTIPALRSSYQKLLIASYFSSLLEYWLMPEEASPKEYDLLTRALGYIEEEDVKWKGVTHFEKELFRLLGYATHSAEVSKVYTSSRKLTELREKVRKGIKA